LKSIFNFRSFKNLIKKIEIKRKSKALLHANEGKAKLCFQEASDFISWFLSRKLIKQNIQEPNV